MKLTETQFKKLEQAEQAVRIRIGKSILERGLFVDRSMPTSGHHYHKYILFLGNGQEINFRDYFMDEISMTVSMPNIIQTVIGCLDLLVPYVKGKFEFRDGDIYYDWSITTENANECFRDDVKDNGSLLKLVDDPRVAERGNVIFHRKDGEIYVLHSSGLSRAGWQYMKCSADNQFLTYAVSDNASLLDYSDGVLCFRLRQNLTEEQIQEFLDALIAFIDAVEELKGRYPGKRFTPQVFFKPMKTKTKFVPKEVDGKAGIRRKMERVPCDVDLNVGDKVSHKTFGDGTITSIDHEKGRVTIDFKRFGEKLLSYRVARLKKIEQ